MNVELVPAAKQVSPGDTLAFRLVNGGPGSVSYGFPYEVQRKDGETWLAADVHPPDSAFSLPAFLMLEGGSREQVLELRPDVRPGWYRVVKHVTTESKPVELNFEFEVIQAAGAASR